MEDNGTDAWELSKENIQPRKEGRNITSLMMGLTPRKENFMKLHNEKQQFELALRTYDGPDKLEIWYRYIVWAEQHFPGGSGFEIRELIERCIQFYKDDTNFKHDDRYLSIWLKYADMLTDPTEVFNYLYSQDIGTKCSQFYESWATALENSGLLSKADEVYNLGEARGAEPLDKLKRQHREFEKRLVAKIKHGEEFRNMSDVSEGRTSLAPLKKTSKGNVGHDRVQGRSESSRNGFQIHHQGNKIKNSAFAVYQDENAPVSKLPSATGEWKQPPTNSVIIKENTQKAGQWNKAKVPKAQSSVERQGPLFNIHVDEGVERLDDTPKQLVMSERQPLSSRKLDKKEVGVDPLKPLKQQIDSKIEVKYCKNQIYMGNGECSFEELRGAAWLKQNGPIHPYSTNDDRTTLITLAMDIDDTILATSPHNASDNGKISAGIDGLPMPFGDGKCKGLLEELPNNRSNSSARQKLSFQSTQIPFQNEASSEFVVKTSQNVLLDNCPLPGLSPAPRSLLHKTDIGKNLDVSGFDPIDDTENFEPLQSTTKYDINKIRQGICHEMEQRPKAFVNTELSKFGQNGDFEDHLRRMNLQDEKNGHANLEIDVNTPASFFTDAPSRIEMPALAPINCSEIRGLHFQDRENAENHEDKMHASKHSLPEHDKTCTNNNENSELSRHWVQMPNNFIKPKPVNPAINTQELMQSGKKQLEQMNGKQSKFMIFEDDGEKLINSSQKENMNGGAFARVRSNGIDTAYKQNVPDNIFEDGRSRKALGDKIVATDVPLREPAPFAIYNDSDDVDMPAKHHELNPAISADSQVATNAKTMPEGILGISTPSMNAKQKTSTNKSPGFQMKEKSPFWAPSPTVHTRKAQMEILAMFNKTLDCDKNEFTLYQTQDDGTLDDFENQFADTKMKHENKEMSFKIFEEETNESRSAFANVYTAASHPEQQPIHMERDLKTAERNPYYADALTPYSLNQNSIANSTRVSSTPSAANASLPPISCSTILHETCPFTFAYPIKNNNLSPIEENSEENKTSSVSVDPFNSWKNPSKSMMSRTTLRSSETDDEHSVEYHTSSNEIHSLPSENRILNAISDHGNNTTANRSMNSSIRSSKATQIVNLSDMNLVSKAVRTMDFGKYPNFCEFSESLGERFAVKSTVNLGNRNYKLLKKIATGGFSVVYHCLKMDVDNFDSSSNETVLKVMKSDTLCSWEFYISQQIHERIAIKELCPDLHDSFILPERIFTYDNGAVIEYPYFQEGTLLDLVNKISQASITVSEDFALIYAADICRTVKAIHDCNIIHGDIKPDNFLQRSNLTQFHDNKKINLLVLADFGKSIDLNMFSTDVQFIGSCNTDKFECIEMSENLPWKYQIDYYGIACTINVLIYGVYMEYYKTNGRYRITKSVKRRWDREFWPTVFDRLLNAGNDVVLDELVSDFDKKLEQMDRTRLEQALKFKNQLS